jgi:hypothetical protein
MGIEQASPFTITNFRCVIWMRYCVFFQYVKLALRRIVIFRRAMSRVTLTSFLRRSMDADATNAEQTEEIGGRDEVSQPAIGAASFD